MIATGGRKPPRGPIGGMDHDGPAPLSARIRWGNVARAGALVALAAAIVTWPRLSPREPALPSAEPVPVAPSAPAMRADGAGHPGRARADGACGGEARRQARRDEAAQAREGKARQGEARGGKARGRGGAVAGGGARERGGKDRRDGRARLGRSERGTRDPRPSSRARRPRAKPRPAAPTVPPAPAPRPKPPPPPRATAPPEFGRASGGRAGVPATLTLACRARAGAPAAPRAAEPRPSPAAITRPPDGARRGAPLAKNGNMRPVFRQTPLANGLTLSANSPSSSCDLASSRRSAQISCSGTGGTRLARSGLGGPQTHHRRGLVMAVRSTVRLTALATATAALTALSSASVGQAATCRPSTENRPVCPGKGAKETSNFVDPRSS